MPKTEEKQTITAVIYARYSSDRSVRNPSKGRSVNVKPLPPQTATGSSGPTLIELCLLGLTSAPTSSG